VRERVNGLSSIETHDGALLRVPSERLAPAALDAVRVGVRPEKVQLVPAGDEAPSGANVLRGTVTVASFLGVSIHYLVRAAGGEELTVVAPNRDGVEPTSYGPGREVLLTWDPNHTFVVGKESSPDA
jgi:spermidine/putrescine transport system ATP-binding protein